MKFGLPWSSLPFHVWWLKTDMLTELLQQSRQPSPLELVWCTKWGQSWRNTGTWLPLSQQGPRHRPGGWRASVRRCPRCWAGVRMRGAGFCGSCWSRKTKRVGRRVREHRSHWTIGLETRTSKIPTPNRFWNWSFADVLFTVEARLSENQWTFVLYNQNFRYFKRYYYVVKSKLVTKNLWKESFTSRFSLK